MRGNPRLVVVGEETAVIKSAVKILSDAGWAVASAPRGDGFGQMLRTVNPAAVVVGIRSGHPEDWGLVSVLGEDEATRCLPIIALRERPDSVADGQASVLVVNATDDGSLLQAVDEAVGGRHRDLSLVATEMAVRQVADVLDAQVERIVADWEERTWSKLYPQRSDLKREGIVGNTAALVRGVAEALRGRQEEVPSASWTRAGRGRAVLRRQQGVAIGDLVREYQILREVMWDTLQDPMKHVAPEALYQVARSLHGAIDTMVSISTSTYGEELRCAMRRAQDLAETSRLLVAALDVDEILSVLARRTTEALGSTVSVVLVEQDGQFTPRAVHARDSEMASEYRRLFTGAGVSVDRDLVRWLVASGPLSLVSDVEKANLPTKVRTKLRELRITSYLSVPLSVPGRQIGWLFSAASSGQPQLDQDARQLAFEFARFAGLATGNAQQASLARERAEELNATLDAIADGVMILGPAGEVVRMNAGAQRLFSYSLIERQRPLTERLRRLRLEGEDGRPLRIEETPTQRALRGEMVQGVVMRIHRTRGAPVWVSSSAAPVHAANGRLLGAVAIFVDITELKRSEEALRKYRLLSENARDIILFVAPDGRILEANEAAVKSYGFTREELVSMSIYDLRAPSTAPAISQQMAMAEFRGILFEAEHRRKDGSVFPVEVSSRGARLLGGERVLLSIIRDITERKRLEERERLLEQLRQRAEELGSVIENTRAQLALLDTNFRFIMVNSAYATGSGYTKEQLIGRDHFALFPNPENRAIFERVRDTGEAYEATEKPFEYAGQPWRGVTYWNWTLAPIKDGAGRVVGLLLSLIEVTEQVRARQQVQELAERAERRAEELDATIRAVSVGLTIHGPNGEIVRMNGPAEQLLGLAKDQARKMSVGQWVRNCGAEDVEGRPIQPEDAPQSRALRGETVTGYRLAIKRPDGRTAYLLVSAGPIEAESGQVVGAVASFSDITPIVELQRIRDDFTSIVAHDIRQPLTIIQGQSQLVERALAASQVDLARRSNEAVMTSSKRMNVMIQDLVDSVRLEAGRLELRRQPIDLGDFLAKLLERAAASLDTSRVKLVVAKDIAPVLADPDRLERIVLNLLSNALKYSAPGTEVWIRVARRGSEALVSVTDQGQGIHPEDLPHLFERFHLTRGPRKKESIGLGLYITKMLVEAHRGRVWVESQLGQGSTFTFSLPLA